MAVESTTAVDVTTRDSVYAAVVQNWGIPVRTVFLFAGAIVTMLDLTYLTPRYLSLLPVSGSTPSLSDPITTSLEDPVPTSPQPLR